MWCANDNRGSPDAHWRLSSGESISPIHFLHLIIKHIIIHKNVTPLQEIKTKSGQFVFVLLLDSWWVLKVTCLDANRGVTYIILQECNKYNCQKRTQIKLIERTNRKNWEQSWISLDNHLETLETVEKKNPFKAAF